MASNINADNGVVSGSAGLKTSADSTGVLALQTNGTTAVTVDTSQNVGVGTTTPASFGKFGVRGAVTLATWGATSGHFSDAATGSLYITHSSNKVSLKTDADLELFCNNTGDAIIFSTNATERLRIPSDASGITFPATQVASSNANTLDDYEEGTWTPSIGGTATYNAQNGSYIKIGQLVYVFCYLNINAQGTGSTTTVSGLPFNVRSSAADRNQAGSINYFNNLATSVVGLFCQPISSSTQVNFPGLTASSNSVVNPITVFQGGAQLYFSAVYQTNT